MHWIVQSALPPPMLEHSTVQCKLLITSKAASWQEKKSFWYRQRTEQGGVVQRYIINLANVQYYFLFHTTQEFHSCSTQTENIYKYWSAVCYLYAIVIGFGISAGKVTLNLLMPVANSPLYLSLYLQPLCWCYDRVSQYYEQSWNMHTKHKTPKKEKRYGWFQVHFKILLQITNIL